MPAPKGHLPYAGCEKGGSPKEWTKERIDKEAEALWKWNKDPNSFFFYQFALERNYSPGYMVRFAEQNEKFREAYKYAKEMMHHKLVMGGLFNKLNASMVKFVLYNISEWRDNKELHVTHAPQNTFSEAYQAIDSQKELIEIPYQPLESSKIDEHKSN